MRVTKSSLLFASLAIAFLAPTAAPAQAAAKMITCKDSTKVKDGKGVCSGHGGKVKPAPSKAPAGTPATAAADTKKKKAAAPKPDPATITAAPGGGPGKVWVNLNTGIFHRQGDEKYGKTKRGIYMSEAEALKSGYHADTAKAAKKP